jgi:putative Ca2+/H+ antiporter (TMEM165/GDT1 family)
MIPDILIPFAALALAELGDKTQLCIFLLSSKTHKHMQVLAGAVLAFVLVDGAAILLGSWITYIIPLAYLKYLSGSVFLIYGLLILRDKDGGKACKVEGNKKSYFFSAFSLIFIGEWGDKTQIASCLLSTVYSPAMVFIGVIAALSLVTLMGIYLGKIVSKKLDGKMISKAAGLLFIVIGFSFFFV